MSNHFKDFSNSNDNNDDSIIDEIIKSYIDESDESDESDECDKCESEIKCYNDLNQIKMGKPKEEYEIIMNCDGSGYFLYIKK